MCYVRGCTMMITRGRRCEDNNSDDDDDVDDNDFDGN